MNKKDNNTKIKTKKDNGRIIKRNWWKIAIITFIVVVILVGLSVGLYFLLRPTYSLGSDKYVTNKNVSEISSSIRSKDGKDKAVLFYNEDSQPVNWITWNDPEGEKGDQVDSNSSPLNNVVNNSGRTYYAINIDDYDEMNQIFLDLFVNINNDNPEATTLYDEFEPLTFGDQLLEAAPPTYYLDWAFSDDSSLATPGSTEGDDWGDQSLTFDVDTTKPASEDDDWEYTFTSSEGTPTIKPATVMYFDGETGFLENVISIASAPTNDQRDSNPDIDLTISDWFTYLDEFEFGDQT